MLVWMLPSEIVEEGFARSRVVMMNEGHNGYRRCVRTRNIGCSVLAAAHDAGCRHLAMEALMNSGPGPSFVTSRPEPHGLFAQSDMTAIAETALALGWTLVAYEVTREQTPTVHRDNGLTLEATNHREFAQACNLAEAIDNIDAGAPLMVWCGNGHHSKQALQEWVPMGVRFAELSSIDPFSIDQLATVSLGERHRPRVEMTAELQERLEPLGGTAGFMAEHPADCFDVPSWYDAVLFSTDNRMVGDVSGTDHDDHTPP